MFATVSLLVSYKLDARVLMFVVVVINEVAHPLTCSIDGRKPSVGIAWKALDYS